MEQSPSWEANQLSASPVIPHILRNPKGHTAFTSARHLSLFWARSIQSINPPPISLPEDPHFAVGPRTKTWLLFHASLTGHAFRRFIARHPAHAFVGWSSSLIASRLLTAWHRMFGSQVTNKQTSPDVLFLEPEDCNKETTHSDTVFVFLPNFLQWQSWLSVGVFCKRTIFCVCYTRIHVLMSLIIVTMKFWTVTSPQLVYVNKCHLLP